MNNKSNAKPELLAPAGDYEKLLTAFHFGADAVYLAGKNFGLRAYASNFSIEEINSACAYAHSIGKKVYVALNIFAKNADFVLLLDYLKSLSDARVDAVLVSDLGIYSFVKNNCDIPIHISTQANTTNKYATAMWTTLGAERVVLARETSLKDIKEIKDFCPNTSIECFVHGAMCISYSGRCLLSDYLTGRKSNRGECAQACRWKWEVREVSNAHDTLEIAEDSRGTYLFNSKDLNMIEHIAELCEAGVDSFKIEGRMKSPFYTATVVNAYRRAIDNYFLGLPFDVSLCAELEKASHRKYTTGFYFDEEESRQYYESSRAVEESKFIAVVLDYKDGVVTVEQRNRFKEGDKLEILSCGDGFGKSVTV
ncbi:MAG: peptidase U32 family protein, partial [Clostridia bacterium]